MQHNINLYINADFRFAPSQWEMPLQSNVVSYWLGTNLESALIYGLIILVTLTSAPHINNTLAPGIFEWNCRYAKSFSSKFYWLTAEVLLILSSGDCHWTSLISKHWSGKSLVPPNQYYLNQSWLRYLLLYNITSRPQCVKIS